MFHYKDVKKKKKNQSDFKQIPKKTKKRIQLKWKLWPQQMKLLSLSMSSQPTYST